MSLDIYVDVPVQSSGIFVREGGRIVEVSRAAWDAMHPGVEPFVVDAEDNEFHLNITHNLTTMADEAGLYRPLWRHREWALTGLAGELVPYLEAGIARLKTTPAYYKQFNPPNGWGDYEGLLDMCEQLLACCKAHPEAKVSTHG